MMQLLSTDYSRGCFSSPEGRETRPLQVRLKISHCRRFELQLQLVCDQDDTFRIGGFSLDIADRIELISSSYCSLASSLSSSDSKTTTYKKNRSSVLDSLSAFSNKSIPSFLLVCYTI